MSPEKFVDNIRLVVRDQTVRDMMSILSKPPGRSPKRELLDASVWFNSLDVESRTKLEWIIGRSVDSTVFGFLCVLDGVRAIEGIEDDAKLILDYRTDSGAVRINDEASEISLHDIYNAT